MLQDGGLYLKKGVDKPQPLCYNKIIKRKEESKMEKQNYDYEKMATILGNIPIYGDDDFSIAEYQEAKTLAVELLLEKAKNQSDNTQTD